MTTTTTGPLYPDVHIQLTGEDGNAFAILGRTNRAMRAAGIDDTTRSRFHSEATAGDYDDLLVTVGCWFNIS